MKEFEGYQFKRDQLKKSFNKAALSYDKVAVFQREIGDRLLQRLELIKINPQIIVDLGAGTGYCTRHLKQHYPNAAVFAVDIAIQMLVYAQSQDANSANICADACSLPFNDQSVDLLFSNMMMPWCMDLPQLFKEIQRVLRPNGLLMFASLGPDTLQELRHSWEDVDNFLHVNAFFDMHDMGDALMHAKFVDPVMDAETVMLMYPRVELLLHDLKAMGAHNLLEGRRRGLEGKNNYAKFIAGYEKYRQTDGLLPVTCEVVYGHAWGSDRSVAAGVDSAGNISIPLDNLLLQSHQRHKRQTFIQITAITLTS